MSSLQNFKKVIAAYRDKVLVVERVMEYVLNVVKENKEKFEKETLYIYDLWDARDTSKPGVLFPESFWEKIIQRKQDLQHLS